MCGDSVSSLIYGVGVEVFDLTGEPLRTLRADGAPCTTPCMTGSCWTTTRRENQCSSCSTPKTAYHNAYSCLHWRARRTFAASLRRKSARVWR